MRLLSQEFDNLGGRHQESALTDGRDDGDRIDARVIVPLASAERQRLNKVISLTHDTDDGDEDTNPKKLFLLFSWQSLHINCDAFPRVMELPDRNYGQLPIIEEPTPAVGRGGSPLRRSILRWCECAVPGLPGPDD